MIKKVGFCILAYCVIWMVFIRITNLDVAEGRLFVMYWKQWVCTTIGIVIGVRMIMHD